MTVFLAGKSNMKVWNVVRGNPLFFIVGLILTAFGGIHFTKLAIIPHIQNLLGRL
jgi:hypothetical protein